MSGHETIRVLEVGVDAPVPVENEGKTLKTASATREEAPVSCPPEPSEMGREGVEQNPTKASGESGGKRHFVRSFFPSALLPKRPCRKINCRLNGSTRGQPTGLLVFFLWYILH